MSRSCSTSARPHRLLALALCAALTACSSGGGGGGEDGGGDRLPPDVELLAAFGGLTFLRPVKLVQHPSDATRWYVVEQGGKILTFRSTDPAGTLTTALDPSQVAAALRVCAEVPLPIQATLESVAIVENPDGKVHARIPLTGRADKLS